MTLLLLLHKDIYMLNTNEFVKKAKAVHGDKYDYSLVEYNGIKTKVKIICPKHGIFEQTPDSHLSGSGCPKRVNNKKFTLFQFIEKAKNTHGDKYDYSLVEYKNNRTKVKVICPEHGVFEQNPSAHMKGHGCIKCGIIVSKNKQLYDNETFISKASEVHNNKYDYSLVKYEGTQKKVKIICPKHGVFKQKPNNHIYNNRGCPRCNESKGEADIISILENNNIPYIRQYKFNDCRNILPLPFDFYITNKNICVEYDGIQHYKPIDFFGGIEAFKDIQKKDKIKNKYCKDNNIKLIRIKYDENIEEKLNSLLF